MKSIGIMNVGEMVWDENKIRNILKRYSDLIIMELDKNVRTWFVA